ncbi:MAG: Hsp20/alpha crystallin family protein [Chloroflexi bacterium]|nr:Hsp20/alpha crystallin family protein [Chloroflexota bacterium]
MANLIRWDPLREVSEVRSLMDRAFDDFFSRSPITYDGIGSIDINMLQTDDDVIVKASIPGVKPEDINISVSGDTLTLRGEIKEDQEFKDANYHIREMRQGSFARTMTLPVKVDSDKAKAEFENGVLSLTLPKAEEIKPKTITIKAK